MKQEILGAERCDRGLHLRPPGLPNGWHAVQCVVHTHMRTNSRLCLRQPSVRQIMSIGIMSQKYCEDHSTLGNCEARGICVTPLYTHTPSLALFSFLTVCVTTWNSMPRSSLVFKYNALPRLDLNPEHVAYELCHCVKTLIRYARPTFLRICA